MILGIDTSGLLGGVALAQDGKLMAELKVDARSAASERILPQINHLLEDLGVTEDNIRRIGVSIGPGSFTGLRVGLATAKGLSLGWGIPLVGISSLRSKIAALQTPLPVLAVTAHRRGSLFAGGISNFGGEEVILLDESTRQLADCTSWVAEALTSAREIGYEELLITGDAAALLYQTLHGADSEPEGEGAIGLDSREGASSENLTDRLRLVPGFPGSTPGVVALLASAAPESALIGPADTSKVEPQYLRGSDAKLPGQR